MSEDIAAELLFCEFRSNLTRTTSHDWHVQPYCQRSAASPHWAAAFGLGRHITLRFWPPSSKPFKHTTRFSVLSTREPQWLRGAPDAKRAICRSGLPWAQIFQRTKAPERSNFVKDLVLEVFGFPTNPAEQLGPASSPMGGAACKKC